MNHNWFERRFFMYTKKVEIPRLNTTTLKTLPNQTINELFIAFHNGDKSAKDKLVEANIKLVLSILRRFHTTQDNINDMFQIGCIGLLKAIDNFDLSVGVCFSTYAVPLIIGEMRRANRDSSSIRVSRGIKDLAYKILDYKEKYMNLHGISPTNEEIAKYLNIEEYLISYCLDSLKEPISIYTPIYNDGGSDTLFFYLFMVVGAIGFFLSVFSCKIHCARKQVCFAGICQCLLMRTIMSSVRNDNVVSKEQ